jgi:hypothetical protein
MFPKRAQNQYSSYTPIQGVDKSQENTSLQKSSKS